MIPQETQEMIARGTERIQQEWKRRDEEKAAQEQAYQAQVAEAWDRFEAGARAALPPELHPFLRIERKNDHEPDRWWEVAEIQIEGLVPIRISLHRGDNGEYTSATNGKRLIVAGMRDAEISWSDGQNYGNTHKTDDLEEALGLARLRHEKLILNEATVEAEQARREAEYREIERKQAERHARKQAEDQREADARRELFDSVARDPVALVMLRVFVALQGERAEWEERLSQSAETASAIEYSYDQQLANVRAKESRALQEADDARRRAEDAEYELARAKRAAR